MASALAVLRRAIESRATGSAELGPSGLLRFEVPLPRSLAALDWLRGQSARAIAGAEAPPAAAGLPKVYFSPRRFATPGGEGSQEAEACTAGMGSIAGESPVSPTVAWPACQRASPPTAGLGAAWLWQGQPGEEFGEQHRSDITSFLGGEHPRVRALGALRFHPHQPSPAAEWAPFGSFLFLLPAVEVQELPNATLISAQMAWREAEGVSPADAARRTLAALAAVRPPAAAGSPSLGVRPTHHAYLPGQPQWAATVTPLQESLAPAPVEEEVGPSALLDRRSSHSTASTSGNGAGAAAHALTKVVLARRTDVELEGTMEAAGLLAALQERDPRAYQLYLELPGGGCFLGSTPERLFVRTGRLVASEAVAGTRARGAPGDEVSDLRLAAELLSSRKEHAEFVVVRDWVEAALRQVCDGVAVERSKSLLRHEAVQHLYGRLSGLLRPGKTDVDLLRALHPTPAVCGQPREESRRRLQQLEAFDRGLYAGPFGWIAGASSEFVVAIRSALVHPPPVQQAQQQRVSLYAGVGIVRGSDADSEWRELELKTRQFEKLLQGKDLLLSLVHFERAAGHPALHVAGPPALSSLPNVNSLWAYLLVEELCRLGVSTFCIAPGSRSSPLTVAAASHPRAKVVTCIDERSLAFYALGHSKGRGRPCAVVTSSGTAVANLLPAVVEASQSAVPLVILTADRPPELRDTGANQTIDQVKIFGSYVRWSADLPAPDAAIKARAVLTAADTAVRRALGPLPGPVHLNFPCREPLAPTPEPFPAAVLEGLRRWERSERPYTAPVPAAGGTGGGGGGSSAPLEELLGRIQGARRGLLVVAGLTDAMDVAAAAELARVLGWPVAADCASGLRLFGAGGPGGLPGLLHHMDHVLLSREHWGQLQPDVVLQVGAFLTSKRLAQFLEWSALRDGEAQPTAWIYASNLPGRHDPAHLLTCHVDTTLPALAQLLRARLPPPSGASTYLSLLAAADAAAGAAVERVLGGHAALSEPLVARVVARQLPVGSALYLGNSMPIRDMDMYGSPAPSIGPDRLLAGLRGEQAADVGAQGVGVPVGVSRGASGIDGVLSSAVGFAEGLGRPVTFLVGDVSFLHDTNGMTLLRGGQGRPPITIVLVNNGGGGIFRRVRRLCPSCLPACRPNGKRGRPAASCRSRVQSRPRSSSQCSRRRRQSPSPICPGRTTWHTTGPRPPRSWTRRCVRPGRPRNTVWSRWSPTGTRTCGSTGRSRTPPRPPSARPSSFFLAGEGRPGGRGPAPRSGESGVRLAAALPAAAGPAPDHPGPVDGAVRRPATAAVGKWEGWAR